MSSSFVSANSVVTLVSTQGYLSLFVLMVLESASLPIPSEVVLPFAGYLVYIGSMNFGLALLDSTVAGVIGALFIYYLAFKLGRPFVDSLLGRVGVKPRTIDSAERWMSTRGSWSVLVARFIPGLRFNHLSSSGRLRDAAAAIRHYDLDWFFCVVCCANLSGVLSRESLEIRTGLLLAHSDQRGSRDCCSAVRRVHIVLLRHSWRSHDAG